MDGFLGPCDSVTYPCAAVFSHAFFIIIFLVIIAPPHCQLSCSQSKLLIVQKLASLLSLFPRFLPTIRYTNRYLPSSSLLSSSNLIRSLSGSFLLAPPISSLVFYSLSLQALLLPAYLSVWTLAQKKSMSNTFVLSVAVNGLMPFFGSP
jgi:hypothetical protein